MTGISPRPYSIQEIAEARDAMFTEGFLSASESLTYSNETIGNLMKAFDRFKEQKEDE